MQPSIKVEYVVDFIGERGEEERYATRRSLPLANQKFELAKRSRKRLGRRVALSKITYVRDKFGYWNHDTTEMLDGG